MRIAHISIYPPKGQKHANTGGVASYTMNLITNTKYESEDEIFVLCDKINGKSDKYTENFVKVIRCFDRSPKFIYQLFNEIKRINPDVLHVQHELALFGNVLTAYLLQWLLLLLKRKKIIITFHGAVAQNAITKKFVVENNSKLPPLLVKLAFRIIFTPLVKRADNIIVHEELFKEILIKDYGAQSKIFNVIPHGVEIFSIIEKTDACHLLKLDPKKNVVLFMGYLTGYKGLDLLIEGFSEYLKSDGNAFLIIGAGKHPKLKNNTIYLNEYTRLVKKARAVIPKESYRWVGFIDEADISTYYSAADISIYPYTNSISSSGPMAIAIGHGKPFLASDVFAMVVSEPELVFKKDKYSLALSLKDYFQNPKKYILLTHRMRKLRLWNLIGNTTRLLYVDSGNITTNII